MNVVCDVFCILQESCLLLHNKTILNDYTVTCGATLSDLEPSDGLSKVCMHDLQCYEPLEKLIFDEV